MPARTPTRVQRLTAIVLGTVLVVAGLVVFVVTDGLAGLSPTHVVSALLVVAGLGTIRFGTRPRRDQVV